MWGSYYQSNTHWGKEPLVLSAKLPPRCCGPYLKLPRTPGLTGGGINKGARNHTWV